MIEVKHITKSYKGNKALDDVSLSLGRNETLCIIGSMGSGKSTLLRCMAGLEHPEEGEIYIDGVPLKQKNEGGYNHIGMVFQSFNLFPHFNVLHNLTLAPIKVLGLSKKEAEEQAYQQLQKDGSYTIFLQGVDLAGFTDIVDGKNLMTVMAPDDEAFQVLEGGEIG